MWCTWWCIGEKKGTTYVESFEEINFDTNKNCFIKALELCKNGAFMDLTRVYELRINYLNILIFICNRTK